MTTAKVVGRFSARFTRGYGRAAIILGIINILMFAKIYQETFAWFGVDILTVILGTSGFFICLRLIVGYIEERLDLWGEETAHIWKMAGWNPVELTETVKRIEKRLEEKT